MCVQAAQTQNNFKNLWLIRWKYVYSDSPQIKTPVSPEEITGSWVDISSVVVCSSTLCVIIATKLD